MNRKGTTHNVALVTGASSGIGKAAVRELLSRGITVYAGARRTERMEDIRAEGARPLGLDVTDEQSMAAAVSAIAEEAGSLDILINNAGYGTYGAVEDVTLAEARRQFDVNMFGLARLTQLALPLMRKQGSGRIINVSSMGGRIYTPLGAWYHATKHAVEGFSDCLRFELRQFGIDVSVIQPGAIQSEWESIAADSARKASGEGAYARLTAATVQTMENAYTKGRPSAPEVVARAIAHASLSRRPRTRYAPGRNAKLLLTLRRWLSDRVFDAVVRMAYGI
ncbi:oxidoreductase [Salinispira pacifica]|uniref:Short-chain dehydrogenase/oxidoreductase n=1 Tax=Salinispira pacifica TaxID=1307761 RepID=V5WEN7_9SPIO|nr:oxidoreductase [Salinispira pacifica]AHC14085.1 short-chain dehydrogenase/oxidoreductase [Salinispira pacifica]